MGLGKTACVLTAISDMLLSMDVYGVLVLGPRRVVETVWRQEALKWEHTRWLRVSVLRGKKPFLVRELHCGYHIYVINYESLPWLYDTLNQHFFGQGKYPPFNMIVYDEVTRVKNPSGKRISPFYTPNRHGVCVLDYIPRRVGLTGTPAPNGYWDLHGQYLAVDGGQRLERDQGIFREKYFIEDPYSRKRRLAVNAKEHIESRIADITLSMRDDEYLQLPPFVTNVVWTDLPPKAREAYDKLEDDMFLEMESGSIQAKNAAALTVKCRQASNGAVIDSVDASVVHHLHDAKLDALGEVLEEAGGSGVLISYSFRSDARRIIAAYGKDFDLAYIGPGVSAAQVEGIIEKWNAGQLDGIVTHPASAGHGLNIQLGGHQIVWFGLTFNLEEFQQLNARLRRQGQPADRVIIHMILARGTVDEAVKRALDQKLSDEDQLWNALREYQRSRT